MMMKLAVQKREVKTMKDLGFQVDPWDFYLYFDSQYFIKLLLNSVGHPDARTTGAGKTRSSSSTSSYGLCRRTLSPISRWILRS
jgi:hypothetical protein